MLQEKKYQNYFLATKYYKEGLEKLKFFGPRGKDLSDFATNGLMRIKTTADWKVSDGSKNLDPKLN
jgi:hypothetical protein